MSKAFKSIERGLKEALAHGGEGLSFDEKSEYEVVTKEHQVQWWAIVGYWRSDRDCSVGSYTIDEKCFPSRIEAEAYLNGQGWVYDSRLMRFHNERKSQAYIGAEIRRVEEHDRKKWE